MQIAKLDPISPDIPRVARVAIAVLFIFLGAFPICGFGADGAKEKVRSHVTDETYFKAIRTGNVEIVVSFLAQGGNVNARERNGDTALPIAAGAGQKTLVELLIAKGADVNKYGRRAVFTALQAGHEDIAELLITRGVNIQWDGGESPSLLTFAVQLGNIRAVDFLIRKGANVNSVEKFGATPLHSAVASNRRMAIVQLLLSNGADVNLKNSDGSTPLHWASRGAGNKKIIQLLIDKGADVNAKNRRGWTPLIAALETHHREAADLLLEKGADVGAKNAAGLTALYWARKHGYRDIEEKLIARGAKE